MLIHHPQLGRVMTSHGPWQTYVDILQRCLVCVFDIFQKPRIVGFFAGRHLKIEAQVRLPVSP